MKNQLTFFFLFIISVTYSQEKRKLISGKIFFENIKIADVHVVNTTSKQGTNSNENGWFEIPVTLGDTLLFTHVNLQKLEIIITQEMILKNHLTIDLKEKIEILDEITIGKQKNMFLVQPNLYPEPIVNATTLKLPFANSTVKKEDKIFKIRSGGLISLDNLINSLNGNNRRKKALQKLTKEDNALSKIRKHFTDDFFITDLNIKKENINSFLNYCFRKNIVKYYRSKKNIKLTKILIDESKTFVQKINIDSLRLTKK